VLQPPTDPILDQRDAGDASIEADQEVTASVKRRRQAVIAAGVKTQAELGTYALPNGVAVTTDVTSNDDADDPPWAAAGTDTTFSKIARRNAAELYAAVV